MVNLVTPREVAKWLGEQFEEAEVMEEANLKIELHGVLSERFGWVIVLETHNGMFYYVLDAETFNLYKPVDISRGQWKIATHELPSLMMDREFVLAINALIMNRSYNTNDEFNFVVDDFDNKDDWKTRANQVYADYIKAYSSDKKLDPFGIKGLG